MLSSCRKTCFILQKKKPHLKNISLLKSRSEISTFSSVCSSRRPRAHRRLHPAAAERREELRRPSEQTVHAASPDGRPCFHGNPRRPAHRGETGDRALHEILIIVSMFVTELIRPLLQYNEFIIYYLI